jgi:hypothetical protein
MLSDLKALVEIIEKLFGLKGKERESVGNLLSQISQELTDLATQWNNILKALQKSNALPSDEVILGKAYRMMQDLDIDQAWLAQRNSYQALATFVRHGRSLGRMSPLRTETGADIIQLVEDALSIKGELVGLVHRVVHPGVILMEAALPPNPREQREQFRNVSPDDPSLSEADRIVAKYFQRNGSRIDGENEEMRRNDLNALLVRVETLMALAGEFRATAALYNAGQVR